MREWVRVGGWPCLHAWGRGGSHMPGLSPSQGFVSWRDTRSGSWYIETLDGVLEQWAHAEDLQSLLLRVSPAFWEAEERLLGGPGAGEHVDLP